LKNKNIVDQLTQHIIHIISETNGISLSNTLELLAYSPEVEKNHAAKNLITEFRTLLMGFQQEEIDIKTILHHPVSLALFKFFKAFPIPYFEEHIHLTGSLTADFIFPYLMKLLTGPDKKIYSEKISQIYGKDSLPISSVEDVKKLITLKDHEHFKEYLNILFLPKLILTNKETHAAASFHMATELYYKYNVASIKLKFTLSRSTSMEGENIPGVKHLTEEDVVLGLYQGFKNFQKDHPNFKFILSPCFRKEADFFDESQFTTKKDHFIHQVDSILKLIQRHPELKNCLSEVDTVGDEKNLYRKIHFEEMKSGFRKLQYNGFKIRSHHGETWKNLRKGVQSVDNSMNIWHIDTLEHGLSLGINPNFYFHRLYQRVIATNKKGDKITNGTQEYAELDDMEWHDPAVKKKLFSGELLNITEKTSFLKTKFHTAREIEHYQHDVLNRMINKKVSLVALPSSNLKLTGNFPDYKDHPFTWWEKKGVRLGVGTDNYITLDTNFIQEMLILLYSDPDNLKITKLLMIVTKEKRRPFISHLLWEMRKKNI